MPADDQPTDPDDIAETTAAHPPEPEAPPDIEPLERLEPLEPLESLESQDVPGIEPGSASVIEPEARPRPSRRKAALVITPIIILIIGNYAGGAFFPTLVNDHPLLLIILSPSNRNFVFVADRIDPVSYFVVGTLRLLAPDPLFFLLGRWYGDAAITWMERRTPTYGQLMRTLERWFSKARTPLVTVIPNNPVCLLAGAAGMGVALFAVLDVVGTIGRLVLLKITGRLLANPIGWLLDLIAQYRLPLLAVSFTLVGLTVFREWRAGTSPIEQLLELEDEMTDGDHATDGHAADDHPADG